MGKIIEDYEIKGYNRTSIEERVELAKKIVKIEAKKISEVKEIIDNGLKERSIEGNVEIINNIKQWKKDNKNNKFVIFAVFTMNGHVAVVGAGIDDLKFPQIEKEDCKTTKIINKLKNDNKEASEWDKDQVIVVSVDGIKEKFLTKKDPESGSRIAAVKNVLECRNGVEYFIGELLLDNDVPILNTYSHRNWKYDFWKLCRDNNYNYN